MHEPQPVPAPHARPTSSTVAAPLAIAASRSVSRTAWQRQRIIGAARLNLKMPFIPNFVKADRLATTSTTWNRVRKAGRIPARSLAAARRPDHRRASRCLCSLRNTRTIIHDRRSDRTRSRAACDGRQHRGGLCDGGSGDGNDAGNAATGDHGGGCSTGGSNRLGVVLTFGLLAATARRRRNR
jgi:hypothetical protein